ncbi:unnamed protein product [Owenia fusiformis]|uniref:Protein ELYS n=1 Tax=Owenia fusiformis TaxID=6347 RepID=A0A8S4MYY2_OWEFU|nr:unnamed protein product [Owenia fusiformis]
MKQEQQPSYTGQLLPYSAATLESLERSSDITQQDTCIFGQTHEGGRFSWVARGPALEIINSRNGARIAAWMFGAALKDCNTSITCVSEFNKGAALLIGLETSNRTGMLCMFDVRKSKVVKAVHIPYKVTAVSGVTDETKTVEANPAFSELLLCFQGIVAVGTQGGHVYIIDMCLDEWDEVTNEVTAGTVCMIDIQSRDFSTQRLQALHRDEHLCIELDRSAFERGAYKYRKQDGKTIRDFSADTVVVTSLKYIGHTGLLAVGFNFGSFQLWKMYNQTLEYSCRFEEDLPPVTHFAYQEPENDPRKFVYIWVGRGPRIQDSIQGDTGLLCLYQLAFNERTIYGNCNILYEDLMSVGPRFDYDLTGDVFHSQVTQCDGSRLVECYTIETSATKANNEEDSFDEGVSGPDMSLCVFVWEAANEDPHSKPSYFLGMFDLNRWYQSQMPGEVRLTNGGLQQCPYFAFCILDDVLDAASPDCLLSVYVEKQSITKFQSNITPAPELHFYPSSLAFDATCLMETGIVHTQFLGVQRQIISDLIKRGPGVLADPRDVFKMSMFAGLLPCAIDPASVNIARDNQRATVLSMLLDYNAVGFISTCITQWAEGEYNHLGCTLRFLLDWAWKKVGSVKEALDKLCVPLYDYTGHHIDDSTMQLLNMYQAQLDHMVTIFKALSEQTPQTTAQGSKDLETKLNVVTLISQHLHVVLWCVANGLLPEFHEGDHHNKHYFYPASILKQQYQSRREALRQLHSDVSQTDLLLIDGIVNEPNAGVKELWEKDGGDGLYPPPNLHALLNIYLLENVSVQCKHCMVLYVLFDLVSLLAENNQEQHEQLIERMSRFYQAFSIPQGLIRLIQGYWFLDRKDFDQALTSLLDPMIDVNISLWQQVRVIKAFLYQGHHQKALRFIRIRKPPMETPELVKLKLTVLLANGLTSEAFEYQRLCRDEGNLDDLLSHFFLGCQQTKMIDSLLQLPMNDVEERQLIGYLQETKEPNSKEILIMHYLQRSRYVDAIRLNERVKQTGLNEADVSARERAAARNAIVSCYSNVLPTVQRKLTFGTELIRKRPTLMRREVVRPRPLSTVVNNKRGTIVSHATLINAVLEKVNEAKDVQDEEEIDVDEQRDEQQQPAISMEPFTCTPITPKLKSRRSGASEVVYPSVSVMEDPSQVEPLLPMSPMKHPHISTTFTSTPPRRMSNYLSAEVLSLLSTPPVKRKTPSHSPKVLLPQPTPQSILKVRRSVRKSPSSLQKDPVKVSARFASVASMDADLAPPRVPRRIGFSEPEASTSTSTPKAASTPTLITPHTVEHATPGSKKTPSKQLRFAVSFGGETSPPKEESRIPSPRSVKDRSPTPERKSPKMASRTDTLVESPVRVGGASPLVGSPEESLALRLDTTDNQEEEDMEGVQNVDNDITFNLNKSVNKGDQEEQDHVDIMDVSHDTPPLRTPEQDHLTETPQTPQTTKNIRNIIRNILATSEAQRDTSYEENVAEKQDSDVEDQEDAVMEFNDVDEVNVVSAREECQKVVNDVLNNDDENDVYSDSIEDESFDQIETRNESIDRRDNAMEGNLKTSGREHFAEAQEEINIKNKNIIDNKIVPQDDINKTKAAIDTLEDKNDTIETIEVKDSTIEIIDSTDQNETIETISVIDSSENELHHDTVKHKGDDGGIDVDKVLEIKQNISNRTLKDNVEQYDTMGKSNLTALVVNTTEHVYNSSPKHSPKQSPKCSANISNKSSLVPMEVPELTVEIPSDESIQHLSPNTIPNNKQTSLRNSRLSSVDSTKSDEGFKTPPPPSPRSKVQKSPKPSPTLPVTQQVSPSISSRTSVSPRSTRSGSSRSGSESSTIESESSSTTQSNMPPDASDMSDVEPETKDVTDTSPLSTGSYMQRLRSGDHTPSRDNTPEPIMTRRSSRGSTSRDVTPEAQNTRSLRSGRRTPSRDVTPEPKITDTRSLRSGRRTPSRDVTPESQNTRSLRSGRQTPSRDVTPEPQITDTRSLRSGRRTPSRDVTPESQNTRSLRSGRRTPSRDVTPEAQNTRSLRSGRQTPSRDPTPEPMNDTYNVRNLRSEHASSRDPSPQPQLNDTYTVRNLRSGPRRLSRDPTPEPVSNLRSGLRRDTLQNSKTKPTSVLPAPRSTRRTSRLSSQGSSRDTSPELAPKSRGRGRPREMTPDSVFNTDTDESACEGGGAPSFTFSNPMPVNSPEGTRAKLQAEPVSPAKPFVFSPPATRTRSGHLTPTRKTPTRSKPTRQSSRVSSTSESESIPEATKPRRGRPPKNKKNLTSMSNSPINFISPIPEESVSTGVRTRLSSQKSSTAPRNTRTRSTGGLKKKQPKLW